MEKEFRFRRGVGTRDAIGLLRVIEKSFMDKESKVNVVFVDLKKTFERVSCDQLLCILNVHGIDWRERCLISIRK